MNNKIEKAMDIAKRIQGWPDPRALTDVDWNGIRDAFEALIAQVRKLNAIVNSDSVTLDSTNKVFDSAHNEMVKQGSKASMLESECEQLEKERNEEIRRTEILEDQIDRLQAALSVIEPERQKIIDDFIDHQQEIRILTDRWKKAENELEEVKNNSVRLLCTPCLECAAKDNLLAKAEEEIKKLDRYIGSMGA